MRIPHPNVWKFITFIQTEQGAVERKIVQMKSGVPSQPKTKRSIDYEQRLRRIVQTFDHERKDDEYFLEYLGRIAHNILYANAN